LGEQLITPGDRRIDRLLASGQIAQARGREQDIVRQSAEQILRGEHFDPRGGELECQRQRIKPSTDGGYRGSVRRCETKVRLHVPNPFHE
jgi:hypothetical protein